jgi:hypothetical protein
VTGRRIAALAAGLLLLVVVVSQPLAELPRRVRTIVAFAPRELAVRRLGGSGTAFDRRFFSFLENARRRIPPGTPGVILRAVSSEPTIYLASYYLAPLPVLSEAGFHHDRGRPPGWITAVYGDQPMNGFPLARLPEGVLLGPSPESDR